MNEEEVEIHRVKSRRQQTPTSEQKQQKKYNGNQHLES